MPEASEVTVTVTGVVGSALVAVIATPVSRPFTVAVGEVTSKAPGPVPTRRTVSVPDWRRTMSPRPDNPLGKASGASETSEAAPVVIEVSCRRYAVADTWTAVARTPAPAPLMAETTWLREEPGARSTTVALAAPARRPPARVNTRLAPPAPVRESWLPRVRLATVVAT